MAKAGQLPFSDAMAAIAVEKCWAGSTKIRWKAQGGQGLPHSYKSRNNLSVNGVIQEGYFVDLFLKFSDIEGVPDKVYMTFVVTSARVVALDENGPAEHVNTVGLGRDFYRQSVSHPHLHVPVPEGCGLYAEPVERTDIQGLWRIFLGSANILEAPPLTLPPRKPKSDSGQWDLL